MLTFKLIHPKASSEMLGLLPTFWSELDPRPAKVQANLAYAHGGGWQPFNGFRVASDGSSLSYPDVRPLLLLAEAKLRDETIRLYECSWVSITQPDGSVEIARMD